MEVTVEADGERIPCELEAKGEGSFEVTFMGEGERTHTLNILFNGEHIPGKFPLNICFFNLLPYKKFFDLLNRFSSYMMKASALIHVIFVFLQ